MQGLSLLPEFVISINIICCDGGWLPLWLSCLLFVHSWWSLTIMYNKCMCLHIGSHFPAFWIDADVVQGCHWEAGSRIFPQLLGMVSGYFHRKIEEKYNQKKSQLFHSPHSCWNLSDIPVVVQFYPRFRFYFPLFQTHYHTLPHPKTKENKM